MCCEGKDQWCLCLSSDRVLLMSTWFVVRLCTILLGPIVGLLSFKWSRRLPNCRCVAGQDILRRVRMLCRPFCECRNILNSRRLRASSL